MLRNEHPSDVLTELVRRRMKGYFHTYFRGPTMRLQVADLEAPSENCSSGTWRAAPCEAEFPT